MMSAAPARTDMSLHRWNAKRDANEKAIVEALRAAGALVFHLSASGLPDLLAVFRGRWIPLEIKRARRRTTVTDRRGRSLTPAQCATYRVAPFAIVSSVEEALQAIGAMTR
jgi:hypothetical protein